MDQLDPLDLLDLPGLQDPDLLYHQGHQGFPDLLDRLAHQGLEYPDLDQDHLDRLALVPVPVPVLDQALALALDQDLGLDQVLLDPQVPEQPNHQHPLQTDQTVLQNHRYLFVRCHPDLRHQEYHHCFYPSNSNLLSRYLVRFQKHHPVLPLYL